MNELSQILNDIELLIKDLSEELVSDLGIRDELEYEKELKNTFISLLLSIQSRRRACSTESGGTSSAGNLIMLHVNEQLKVYTTLDIWENVNSTLFLFIQVEEIVSLEELDCLAT